MRIAVIDGQGGGIGRVITEKLAKELRRLYPKDVEILALGTNALATSAMLLSRFMQIFQYHAEKSVLII